MLEIKRFWDRNRRKWKASCHWESISGFLAWATSALSLSYDNWTTTCPDNLLYVLHRWYWMPQLHTLQPLSGRALAAQAMSLGFDSQQLTTFPFPLFLSQNIKISKNPTVLFAEHVRCSTHDTPLWDYGISDLRLGRPWRTTEKPAACTRATSCFSLGGPHQLTNLTGSHSRVYIYGCHVIVVCPGLVFVLNICVYMLINTTNATQVHVIQGTCVLATPSSWDRHFHEWSFCYICQALWGYMRVIVRQWF